MDDKTQAKHWLDSAAHDLDVAETLYQNAKYDWCLFLAHLVVEKTLKARFLQDRADQPPYTHNLLKLAEATSLELTDEQRRFLLEVNDFNIEARYPDFKHSFHAMCTREFADDYFKRIKDFASWLKSQMRP